MERCYEFLVVSQGYSQGCKLLFLHTSATTVRVCVIKKGKFTSSQISSLYASIFLLFVPFCTKPAAPVGIQRKLISECTQCDMLQDLNGSSQELQGVQEHQGYSLACNLFCLFCQEFNGFLMFLYNQDQYLKTR